MAWHVPKQLPQSEWPQLMSATVTVGAHFTTLMTEVSGGMGTGQLHRCDRGEDTTGHSPKQIAKLPLLVQLDRSVIERSLVLNHFSSLQIPTRVRYCLCKTCDSFPVPRIQPSMTFAFAIAGVKAS